MIVFHLLYYLFDELLGPFASHHPRLMGTVGIAVTAIIAVLILFYWIGELYSRVKDPGGGKQN